MRPRNVLTQTNNMRKLMGLPLLNEDTGETAEDVKKKVLTEDRAFSLGFSNQGGLSIQEEEITETTEAEEVEEEGDGEEVNDLVEEQDEYGEGFGYGPEGMEPGIDVGHPQNGNGESAEGMVFAEDSFSKYNITLDD